ncbi:hypothetical protein K1X76_04935 [bacterium]|nr:hypothetical protein [bacterium]
MKTTKVIVFTTLIITIAIGILYRFQVVSINLPSLKNGVGAIQGNFKTKATTRNNEVRPVFYDEYEQFLEDNPEAEGITYEQWLQYIKNKHQNPSAQDINTPVNITPDQEFMDLGFKNGTAWVDASGNLSAVDISFDDGASLSAMMSANGSSLLITYTHANTTYAKFDVIAGENGFTSHIVVNGIDIGTVSGSTWSEFAANLTSKLKTFGFSDKEIKRMLKTIKKMLKANTTLVDPNSPDSDDNSDRGNDIRDDIIMW